MKKMVTHPLAWFIAAIHAVYFVTACAIGRIYLVDSHGYLEQARNLVLHHSWYAETWNAVSLPDYFSFRPPLYGIFIAACRAVAGSDIAVVAVQGLLSMFNFFLLWKLLTDAGMRQKHISIIIGAALVLAPSQLIHANFIMSEILLQTLLMGVFYLSLQFVQTRKTILLTCIAVLLSLAMLTKPVVLLLGAGIVTYLAWLMRHERKFQLLLPFLLLPLTFHFVCLQNRHATGYYHYSSAKILYDLRVNARFLLMKEFGEDSSHAFVAQTFAMADQQPTYRGRYRLIEQQCTEVYKAYPGSLAFMYARGIVTFFIDPGRFDLFNFLALDDSSSQGFLQKLNTEGWRAVTTFLRTAPVGPLIVLFVSLLWNVVVAVCFAWFFFKMNVSLEQRLFVLLFVGYFVAVSGISGIARYRVPVYPELLFAAAFTISGLLKKHRDPDPSLQSGH